MVVALAACGSSPAGTDVAPGDGGSVVCTRADPTCPATPPSYANDIAPVLTTGCIPCHAPGRGDSPTDLVGYANVQRVSGSSLGQVEACLMPPVGSPPLTVADRTALLDWLACGAPDN